ncbi:AraC family transcriptional regulator [Mycolicibacterium sp. 018/SC-01/001]|nr:helix-turn-helix domain-containing protein [Mycolicibacterium sp. 018/SC-01/001]TRW81005.1 AraC family transcriptional regulator [Mycolicibacterium sp. 018/SC-01/001]
MRGVVGRPASASAFDLQRWAPGGAAARFVEHFWSVTWDLGDEPPFESTVLTFPSMHLTREWGSEPRRHGLPLPNTLVHGVVEQVFRTTLSGRGAVVGARFSPGGFVARFGGDAATFTGRVVVATPELLGAATGFDDDVIGAAEQLDDVIGAADHVDPILPLLTSLLERMRDDPDLQRVDQVMAHSPWSVRSTQRVFRRYVGVPVKWVLCRYRLQNAAWEIETDADVDFADLAVRLGWYDQAHFSNDYRAMLGATPGEYAAQHGPLTR